MLMDIAIALNKGKGGGADPISKRAEHVRACKSLDFEIDSTSDVLLVLSS